MRRPDNNSERSAMLLVSQCSINSDEMLSCGRARAFLAVDLISLRARPLREGAAFPEHLPTSTVACRLHSRWLPSDGSPGDKARSLKGSTSKSRRHRHEGQVQIATRLAETALDSARIPTQHTHSNLASSCLRLSPRCRLPPRPRQPRRLGVLRPRPAPVKTVP